jgi:predicted RNA-binding Zn ribbon-like protein
MDTPFPLEGGWLCLGFCNTVGWHTGAYKRSELYGGEEWEFLGAELVPGAHERFSSYRALVGWFFRHRLISLSETKRLLRAARKHPEMAEQVRRRAISLRETIYHLFTALDSGDAPDPRDVASLNTFVPEAWAHRRLAYRTGSSDQAPGTPPFWWKPAVDPDALDDLLWPVVWSAAELLTSDELPRVRECANDPCGWLFLDMSKNRSRRWCDMRDCGNRVKARRHYERVKQARSGGR